MKTNFNEFTIAAEYTGSKWAILDGSGYIAQLATSWRRTGCSSPTPLSAAHPAPIFTPGAVNSPWPPPPGTTDFYRNGGKTVNRIECIKAALTWAAVLLLAISAEGWVELFV